LYKDTERICTLLFAGTGYSELSGKTTEEVRQIEDQLVLAIRRNGQFLFMPKPTELVQAEDVLIVMGPNL